jgi:hypothetical protein
MRIEIVADASAPPAGWLTVDGGPPQTFESWLALLGLLSRVLEEPGDRAVQRST